MAHIQFLDKNDEPESEGWRRIMREDGDLSLSVLHRNVLEATHSDGSLVILCSLKYMQSSSQSVIEAHEVGDEMRLALVRSTLGVSQGGSGLLKGLFTTGTMSDCCVKVGLSGSPLPLG